MLQLREVDEPTVGDDEVLVKVRAASVHPDVWHVISGLPYVLRLMGSGVRRPKVAIPGTDVAGHVVAVGAKVTRLKPGDEVFGESVKGYGWANGGAYAEFVAVAQDSLALKPANVTFEQAAAVPSTGYIALQVLRQRGHPLAGEQVLINGAGGGVGTIALQLAKAAGAQVTGVDSTDKLELLRSLGADRVIDYTREDFTRGARRYDLIFDIPGNHSFSACRRVLTDRGTYLLIAHDHYGRAGRKVLGSVPRVLGLLAMSVFVRQLPKASVSMPSKKDAIATLSKYLQSGQLTPVIDQTFPLSQTAEAIRYLSGGKARGKVVITM
ncbi:NADPH:quinone reductase [Rhizocola hellebori]|uniref:NADPH:quinone reductase n=1 Tax=Rhizocola hellebori TaxID=1392758 RepID=A0A8J3VKW8_9ACTN|nr:NADPH:quinone reductase [Rhizocola hellebori]